MALSYDLISLFAKQVTKNDKKTGTESTVYGTVVVDGNGDKYVKLDGSDQLTPLTDTSANANKDERVSVLIKNHTATVTGNISSPAARTGDVEDLGQQVSEIKKFDIVIADQVQANEGYIKQLQTDKANVGDLNAANAKITELESKKASVEELNAAKAEITDLVADKIDVEVANAKFATIENLNATNATVSELKADNIKINDTLTAHTAEIERLDVNKLSAKDADLKYVNIDFGKIDKAWMKEFYVQSGLIENVVVGDETVTGYLVGVTIKGDLIEGGTVVADTLVIKGEDGLYYKLNTTGITDATFTDGYVKTNQTINEVEGSAVDGAFVFTEYPVYSYIDENEDTIYYCVISDVCYRVDADTKNNIYTNTTDVVEPVDGAIVEGAYVTIDSQVYSYMDGDESPVHYCIIDDVYYLVAVNANSVKVEQTEYNSLNGSIITAKSITATQISVQDLVAFDATIGGFHITEKSIYSGVKESVDNTTQGTYLDSDGQFALGDGSNFVKCYKDPIDGSYKIHISAESIMFSSGANVADILEYIKIDPEEGSITLGGGKNAMSLKFDNDLISFWKNGRRFGWWDGVDFHTGNIKVEVQERAQFGNFAFVPRSDGSLSFLKVEHNSGFYAILDAGGVMNMYGSYPTLEGTTMVISDISGELDGTTLILKEV